ncbi:MAG TPA: acetoacetate--CoA ligase [Candidatus Sphingobacterium stercoripullorum]|uniref:Acetoacetate--CoA ligase n=1 Tax=Candidatus Sphingobacterium stercoripullorum TaxID=2838759 RepID=A0A9D1W8P3_9SPHI|nr:acetoacetate--CoA ligase [Candidatus Sphingobacterium stercoripullorum]
MNKPLWSPSKTYFESSELYKYLEYLKKHDNLHFEDYRGLHEWSILNLERFWLSLLSYMKIDYQGEVDPVLTPPKTSKTFIGAQWFPNLKLSFAEQIFKGKKNEDIAVKYICENKDWQEITWSNLKTKVSRIEQYLVDKGVHKGDRVAGVLSNTPETLAIFLAANSLGAIWSCCSTDFGIKSVADRLEIIGPKILFIEEEYTYNEKVISLKEYPEKLREAIKEVSNVTVVNAKFWEEVTSKYEYQPLRLLKVPFNHPIWILYSSGTTGKPKAITHSTGGNLMELYKALSLHQDVQAGENFLWYSTTGWMMWNYSIGSLLCGATLCIYNGSIAHKNHTSFWNFLKRAEVQHLGAGAAYFSSIHHLEIENYKPKVIGSTGSVLPNETYENLNNKFPNAHIISLSGGTDVCSAFLTGSPMLPVYKGYLQCAALGADIKAYNEKAEAVENTLGELVITKPLPSMPLYFWNDQENKRYKESYYEKFSGVWCHGDWIKSNHKGYKIYGRSDATLNKFGVRIGTAEFYDIVKKLPFIKDALVISITKKDKIILFIETLNDLGLDCKAITQIKEILRKDGSPRHIPDFIFQVNSIPYTKNGKKLEVPIKRIFSGMAVSDVISKEVLKDPNSLNEFIEIYNNKFSINS